MEAEFDALGVPFRERGRRMDEGIAMMKAVWNDDPVTFPTRWIAAKIDTMRMQPKPCAPIPIWIGGSSDAAIARALRLDGWHGSRVTPEQAPAMVRRLREAGRCGFHRVGARALRGARHGGGARRGWRHTRRRAVQHVLMAPEERGIEEYLAAVERVARCAEGL